MPARLDELSDSEQMAMLIAAELDALAPDSGVVVIDAPELYIHPRENAAFSPRSRSSYLNAQIPAATTSPGILRAHPVERVLVVP